MTPKTVWDTVDVTLQTLGDGWYAIINNATSSFYGVYNEAGAVETDASGKEILVTTPSLLVNTHEIADYLVFGSQIVRQVDRSAWTVRTKLEQQDGSVTRLVITTGAINTQVSGSAQALETFYPLNAVSASFATTASFAETGNPGPQGPSGSFNGTLDGIGGYNEISGSTIITGSFVIQQNAPAASGSAGGTYTAAEEALINQMRAALITLGALS